MVITVKKVGMVKKVVNSEERWNSEEGDDSEEVGSCEEGSDSEVLIGQVRRLLHPPHRTLFNAAIFISSPCTFLHHLSVPPQLARAKHTGLGVIECKRVEIQPIRARGLECLTTNQSRSPGMPRALPLTV